MCYIKIMVASPSHVDDTPAFKQRTMVCISDSSVVGLHVSRKSLMKTMAVAAVTAQYS